MGSVCTSVRPYVCDKNVNLEIFSRFLESARPMRIPRSGWKHIEPCSMLDVFGEKYANLGR